MDENKLPVSLGRLFTRIKQSYKGSKGKMLTGAQIRQQLKKAIENAKTKNPSTKFIEALQKFIEDIAQQVSHL
jgi:hypothetical protein